MLKVIKQLLKIIIAAIVSFGILNGFCFLYYNVCIHFVSETKSTDYVWEKSTFYSNATEGFAWGKTDKNGFNNLEARDDIDILVMGSSHMEAFNVKQEYNTVSLLNEAYEKNGIDCYAYNIGTSGHTFLTCVDNLQAALEEFEPKKRVVIETPTIRLNKDDLKTFVEGNLEEIDSTENKLLLFLQEFPLLRLMYFQLSNIEAEASKTEEKAATNQVEKKERSLEEEELYVENLAVVLKEARELTKEKNVDLTIVYNPMLEVEKTGEIKPVSEQEYTNLFESLCDELGIQFINMYEPFVDYYEKTNRLPHGFSNTRVGAGHLNRFGHEVIAQTLFDELQIKEGD